MNDIKQISVTVKFFATLRQYGPDKKILTIPEHSKVKLLFEKFNIPKDERRAIILVNGRPHKDQNFKSYLLPILRFNYCHYYSVCRYIIKMTKEKNDGFVNNL